MSEEVPCADFPMEPRAIMFYSPSWDMLITVVYDDRGEVFCGCVYDSEVAYVYVEVRRCGCYGWDLCHWKGVEEAREGTQVIPLMSASR